MNHDILRRRRGQAAIEFLVTYGWAIMAAMLVIGALTYFGITNPATSLPDKCIFSNSFACKDFLITNTTLKLKVTNTAGQTIYGYYGGPMDFTANMTEYNNAPCITDSTGTLEPDSDLTITCTMPVGSEFNINEKAKVKLSITYRKSPTGFNQVSLGEVYSTVQ
jgi:hypothetical protein